MIALKIESRDINVILTLNAVKVPALSEVEGRFHFHSSYRSLCILSSTARSPLSLSEGVFICLCEVVLPIGKDDLAISSCPWVRIGCGEIASSRFIGTKQRHIDLFIFEP